MEQQKKIAQLIIARLDGRDIKKRSKYYRSLVRKGIGGFIIFGGRLKEVRDAIKQLHDEAEIPLFIASDLEQGLGQQIKGGTFFPPAMAIAQAINTKSKDDIKLLKKSVSIIAQEAKAAGINVIFSPVLDVNTNPENPIICTRAFSDNPKEVAWYGKKFIKGFQKERVIACAKHFPGHGDTAKDSHRELPVVKADIERLYNVELYPFAQAIKAGVKMIMVGHLKVPAIDSRFPSSLSPKIIQGFLKDKMKFKGLVITDAMNMHAVRRGNRKSGENACLMALNAGSDILLHPDNPEKVIDYLSSRWNEIMPGVEKSFQRILEAKKELGKVYRLSQAVHHIGAKSHWKTAGELTRKSINVILPTAPLLKGGEELVILVIDDDNCASGKPFIKMIKNHYKKVNPVRKLRRGFLANGVKTIYIENNYQGDIKTVLNSISDTILIAAVFSRVSAWKGRSGLSMELKTLLKKAVRASKYSVVVSFCCPYFLRELKADAIIEAYGDSEFAQDAAARLLCSP